MIRYAAAVFLVLAGAAQAAPAQTLTLKGPDGQTRTLTAEEFAKLPHVSLTVSFHEAKRTYEGVEMLEALRLVGAPWGETLTGKELADVALATARDGYRVAYSIGEIDPGTADKRVLIADRLDGKPLEARDGPFQVVVEADFRPARSARMVERVELIRLPKQGGAK
jgi:hypothetical protein